MMTQKAEILLVEDDPPLAALYRGYLGTESYEIRHAETGAQALEAVGQRLPDLIVLDLKLPDMDGLEVLERFKADRLPFPVLVVTAHGSVNVAVDAMKAGAADFLLKPFSADQLLLRIDKALEHRKLQELVETYKEDFGRRAFHGFVGSSLPMQSVYRIIESAATSRATVFVTGESGTGKELCAEAIHRCSPRRDQRCLALNCAAIPKDLIESEIFGHVKGAFTGATANRDGAATLADGGTLFLDEICDMPLKLQSKLLRFIQSGSFQKVGSSAVEKVDIRFVCATNRNPWEAVEAGRFREDLYYRLHVIPVQLPPLRDRDQDVLEIAEYLLQQITAEEDKSFSKFSADAVDMLLNFGWPGNVRQLQNVIRTVVVLNEGEVVERDMLLAFLGDQPAMGQTAPPLVPVAPAASGGPAFPEAVNGHSLKPEETALRPMWQIEREMIRKALDMTNNNVPRAAAMLEISPSTVYRRLREMEAGPIG